MMTQTELEAVATKFLEAWNSQDVEAVVACYTPDVVYRDPNTRSLCRTVHRSCRENRRHAGARRH